MDPEFIWVTDVNIIVKIYPSDMKGRFQRQRFIATQNARISL